MPDGFEIPDDAEAAVMLLEMDAIIQSWTKQVDKLAEDSIDKFPDRTVKDIVTSCDQGQSAIPVSIALKAVHFGTLKVVYKVLPRTAEIFIVAEFSEVIEKAAAKIAARTILGSIPFLGAIISVAIGTVSELEYMDNLEDFMHDVLGCVPSKIEDNPMRFALGEYVEAVKQRTAAEPRIMDEVYTRRFGAE